MAIKYAVDQFVINEIPGNVRITLRGWCVSEDGSIPQVALRLNGKKVHIFNHSVSRPDVKAALDIQNVVSDHFGFWINVNENIEHLENITLYAYQGETNKDLLVADEKMIRSMAEHHTIIANYDGMNIDANNVAAVSGWAFSLKNEELTYEIRDDHDEVVNITTRKMVRKDVVNAGIADQEQSECGFYLTFNAREDAHYRLYIHSASETLDFDTVVQPAGKVSLFRNILANFNLSMIKRGLSYLKQNGIAQTLHRVRQGYTPTDALYHDWFLAHRIDEDTLAQQRETVFDYAPKISLIVPVFNTPIAFLEEMVQTVIDQSYENWELCIADGSDENDPARARVQEYAAQDERIKVTVLDRNYGISGNTNEALKLATGEYTALYDHDDFLEKNALYEIVNALNQEKYDVIYTDEDKFSEDTKQFSDPNLKPDYSPDLLRSHNYITHLFVVRTELLRDVGGFDSKYDGSQDYDVVLKCTEKKDTKICHLPMVLYHWRVHEGSTAQDPESKMYCYEAGKNAIQAHMDRMGIKGTVSLYGKPYWGMYHVRYDIGNHPLVSIVIPNFEAKKTLKRCIDSLYRNNSYDNFEVIIVENNSKSEEIFEYYKQIQKEHDNIHVVTWSGTEFNFSAINNFGVKYAKGEYLLFLNNDTEVIREDAIQEMLGCCMRDDVGVVGAKLLYADNTVQHAGVVVGFGGAAGHVFSRIGAKDPGFMRRALINGNYSAVTAACMMSKRDIFDEVGGFDEELKVAFNDIDYCLKVRKTGRLVVYNAFSWWHHYESVSRGYETSEAKRERFEKEIVIFQNKWHDILVNGDPYYNKNFDVNYTPFELH